MSAPSQPAEPRQLLALASMALAVLAATNGVAWYFHTGSVQNLNAQLERQLMAIGAATAATVEAAPTATAGPLLAQFAAAHHLEKIQWVNPDGSVRASSATQGPNPGRVNLLLFDAGAFAKAQSGKPALAALREVEGITFRSTYYPAGGAILILDVNVRYLDAIRAQRRILYAGLALSLLLAAAVAALGRGVWGRLQELRHLAAHAERRRMLATMASRLAHEIRNPLGIVRGSAEVLAPKLPEPDAALALDIVEEADRLNDLVSAFLDLGGGRKLQPELTELGGFLRRELDFLGRRTAPKCAFALDAPLPVSACIDPRALRQAILNLLLNAEHFSPPGASVQVSVRAEPNGAAAVIAIDDQGPGFTQTALARAGEPFYTTREGGTGLGLATARAAIEQHSGTMAVANRPEGGARVTLRLPAGGRSAVSASKVL